MAADGARRVAVAASGGRDSTALLHCTVRVAAGLGVEVVALHVHHGLVADADDWQRRLAAQCRRWGVALRVHRLQAGPPRGASIEAWARRERYRALAAMARDAGCSAVLLAHHRRDQAETVVLQALRGGGPAGLSAMPRSARRDGLVWARPWLSTPRPAIEDYLRRHRIRHADDASNDDPRHARNRLRIAVWPALRDAFPDAEVALARAAGAAQRAAALAAEVAAADLPAIVDGDALIVGRWRALTPARRANALQAWLAATVGRAADDARGGVARTLVDRLLDELPRATSARWPAAGGALRLHRGRLTLHRGAAEADADGATVGAGHADPASASADGASLLDLRRAGRVRIAGFRGHLQIDAPRTVDDDDDGGGVPLPLLAAVTARARSGGERFRIAARGTARSLKKQYQARGVAAWDRDGPLLYTAAGALLWAPGLGVDAALAAAPGEPQRRLRWIADGDRDGEGEGEGSGDDG